MTKTRPARPVVGFAIMIALSLLIYGWSFTEKPNNTIISSYDEMLADAADGNIGAKIAWLFGDWGDPAYQKTALGGILMILGAIIAYYVDKKKKTTFGICYGSGLFWKVLAAQILAALISNFLYQNLFRTQDIAFVPTFIPIVSITPGLILVFGGEWRKVITAAVFGGLIGCPFAYFIFKNFVQPWGLIGAVAWVTPMIVGGLISFETCKYLPWMAKQASDPQDEKPSAAAAAEPPKMNNGWFVKRVFADFSEANFYGNEIAGLFFILGGVISVYLNPLNPGYGDGNSYLVFLSSQILASSIGVFIYWHRYFELGWYPTFVPVVTMGPTFVIMYGTGIHVVLTGALIGGLFMPPVANWIARGLPSHHHPYIGAVASMFICCIVMISIFNQVPGFGV
ncbi:MAG: hypothetical protein FWF38_03880 [Spirochaetaceae bacterium]|nr:hypothetical protein [Spirochaetaceae bacterium]